MPYVERCPRVGGSTTSEAIAGRYLGEEARPVIQHGDAAVLQANDPRLRYACWRRVERI